MLTERQISFSNDFNKFYAMDGADTATNFPKDKELVNLSIKYSPCFNIENIFGRFHDAGFRLSSQGIKSKTCLMLIHGYGSKQKKTYEQLARFEKNIDYIAAMVSLGDPGPIRFYVRKIWKLESMKNPRSFFSRQNRYLAQNCLRPISPISCNPLIRRSNIFFIKGLFDWRASISRIQKSKKRREYPRIAWYPCFHFSFILLNRIIVNIVSGFLSKL